MYLAERQRVDGIPLCALHSLGARSYQPIARESRPVPEYIEVAAENTHSGGLIPAFRKPSRHAVLCPMVISPRDKRFHFRAPLDKRRTSGTLLSWRLFSSAPARRKACP